MKHKILKLLGLIPDLDEKIVYLEERAQHMRKHIIQIEERLSTIESVLHNIEKHLTRNL